MSSLSFTQPVAKPASAANSLPIEGPLLVHLAVELGVDELEEGAEGNLDAVVLDVRGAIRLECVCVCLCVCLCLCVCV